MKKLFQTFKNKKWIFGVVLLFFAVFLVQDGYEKRDISHAADFAIVDSEGREVTGEYELRRATDRFSISITDGNVNDYDFAWTSMNETILSVDSATATSRQVSVNVVNNVLGTAGLECVVTNRTTGEGITLRISVEVVFSINEFLNHPTVSIDRVFPGDARRSIIMKYHDTLAFGENATQTNKLNLIFGNAKNMDLARWTSSNPDVVRVVTEGSDPNIMAVGAGKATLSVVYREGTTEHTASINVYVRPELRKGSDTGELIEHEETRMPDVTMEHGDKIWVSALSSENPLEGILDKITWVVAKVSTSGERTLVRDSEGGRGAGDSWKDVDLVYNNDDSTFRLNAKAGRYAVMFFVKGTYTDFDAEVEGRGSSTCRPVYSYIDVNSRFENKNITISIDGNYNISDAVNISQSVLRSSFTFDTVNSGGGCVDVDQVNMIITGVRQGTAVFTLHCNSLPDEMIPGITASEEITITVSVTDTFSLNVTEAVIAQGAKLDLQGIIGSGQYTDSSSFQWESSDTAGTYVSMSTSGRYATVTGVRETRTDQPVTITLKWTDGVGVTRVATCKVYVSSSATVIPLSRTELEMETGSEYLLNSGLPGSQNLTWISANTDIVTVTPQQGNTSAMLRAGETTGTTIVTVLNKDNNVYATCRVTVTAAITEISIDKGDQVDTVLAAGFVFLKAVYSPANATNTELRWSVNDRSIATVDENGVVTLLREGTVWVTVEPVFNPKNILARCAINIKENPVTDIQTDVTELRLIAGEQYEVQTTIIPPDATYPTLTWASDNTSVARVEGGLITAVSPGDANITVANGSVFKIIKVHVRNRLISIKFKESSYDIKVGTTASLRDAVIFNPSENVNTNLTWGSSRSDVVSIDKDGNITGVRTGDDAYAIITCIAEDLGAIGAITCVVHVIDQDVPATAVALDPVEATIHVGETLQINSIFTPVTATYQNLSWTSTDPTVATVDENGLVTGVAEGTINIGAVYKNPIDGTVWDPIYCKITVLKAHVPIQSVALSPAEMEVFIGQSLPVTPVFTPEDATDRGVTYMSSDDSVATVDTEGMVTGVASGSAVVICRTNEGGFVGTSTVTVISGVSLTLTPDYREIALGKTFTIKKTIIPKEYEDTPVTWSTSNKKIASVTQKGKVKGIKKGSCTITCSLDKYGSTATCRVKVAKLNTRVKLNKTNIRIGLGQKYRLIADVWTNNSKTPSVKWATSNRKVATVGKGGVVQAKRLGFATITATSNDKIKAKATCRVRVIRRATGISIRPNYAICYIGGTKRLTAVVKPRNATIKAVSWKSSDKNIATVEGGVVRGIAEGTVNITATTLDGSRKKATCILKVMEPTPVSNIVVAQSDLTLKKGDTAKLSYTVLPNDTSDDITFASDNKRVATVSANGVVKAVGTGNCTITILSTGGTTSTVSVNVVALNRTSLTMRQYDTETLTVNGTTATVTWYSSNARVATVENGTVVGRSKGTTYIYAYVKGCKLACRVTITDIR